ncbi:MtrAB system histidine kinase MtrB [Actinomyces sp. F1_1611]
MSALLQRVRRRLHRSLSIRVALTLTLMLLALMMVVGLIAVGQMRNELFHVRKDAILEDASVRFTQAQNTLDQSTAATTDQVQDLVSQLVAYTRDSAAGAGAVSVMLLRAPDSSNTFIVNELSNPQMRQTITPALRELVEGGQSAWQSIAIPEAVPGIVVGSLVDVPQAGPYELFIVYSLESEEQSVALVIRIFAVATLPLLLIIAVASFWLVYALLRPVRSTAEAAAKLADGDLESRVEVSGQDEMARLGTAFNNMAQSLQQQIDEYDTLSQLQQQFVSDVSHELRTPLTTISIAGEMIYEARGELSGAPQRSAELLFSEVGRMQEMLADLLEISRYDAQSTQLDIEMTDLYALTQKTMASVQELADHLGVYVTLSARPNSPLAEVDSKRIERVIRNLLVNAYEHAEGKPVQVEVEAAPGEITVRVVDHGVGMSEETIARVFDRFFRADPARARTTGGTGLGLAIAKEDIAAHRGRIVARGALGQGATFEFTVPRKFGFPLSSPGGAQ